MAFHLVPLGSPLPPSFPLSLAHLVPRAVVRQVVHHSLPLIAVVLLVAFLVVQAVVDRRDPRLELARRRRDESVDGSE